MSKNILMVLTNFEGIDKDHRTGLWLEEFTIPYEIFADKGYNIILASPSGREVPVDPRSEPEDNQWAETRKLLKTTIPLTAVDAADYDAIYLPGGHGTMFDFPQNDKLQNVISNLYENGKIISAVCHGPAGLAEAKGNDGIPIVSEKTITSYTNEEEGGTGLEDYMPFWLESRLRERGANFITKPNFSDHVERDGQLITGQNPQSSRSTALAVIEALGD